MTKRIQKLIAAVAALSALALGGSVLAQAQTPSGSPERASAPDRDSVQSGDQTTPDRGQATVRAHGRHHAVRVSDTTAADPAGGGAGQSGSQTAPDTGSGSEVSGSETPETGAGSESASPNDGPGGHADAPGANVDHQFQGNE